MRCVCYREHGEGLWARFNPASDQLWYYRACVDAFRKRSTSPLVEELEHTVTELERAVAVQL